MVLQFGRLRFYLIALRSGGEFVGDRGEGACVGLYWRRGVGYC